MATQGEVEAAAAVLCDRGIEIKLPWECDLDDLERERYEALVAALDASRDARETD